MDRTSAPSAARPTLGIQRVPVAQPRQPGFQAPDGLGARRRRQPLGRLLWSNRLGILGIVILGVVLALAILAPLIAGQDPGRSQLRDRFAPPMWLPGGSPDLPFGGDQLGRSIWARLVFGARVSILVGLTTVAGAGTLGVLVGLLSGYYRGWVDTIAMILVDIQQAFPFLALAIAVVAVLGGGLANTILVLGIAGWVLFARVVRGEVLAVRETQYVEAARALGARDPRIILQHILPNVFSPVIVIATFTFAYMIIAEASLSFLGLGVSPSIPTWGTMLNDGRGYLRQAWWLSTFPGLALMLTVLGTNLIGDWLRDRWDPRLQTGL